MIRELRNILLIFGFAAILWLTIAKSPEAQVIWLGILLFILALKAAALRAGLIWIWVHGQSVLNTWVIKDEDTPEDATEFARRQIVFGELQVTDCAQPVAWSPLGVIDWRWLKAVDEFRASSSPCRQLCGDFLSCLRDLFFRFESLMVWAALFLICRDYGSSQEWSIASASAEAASLLISLMVVCLICMMSIEVLIGNAILKPGYSRYFHRRIGDGRVNWNDRRVLIVEVRHFARLAAFSLLALAAVCQSYFATWSGFHGISTCKLRWEGVFLDNVSGRLELFVQFLSFVVTTFATVGYGDIYPNSSMSRLLVGVVQIVSMGMILVLLQVVLTQKEGRPIR